MFARKFTGISREFWEKLDVKVVWSKGLSSHYKMTKEVIRIKRGVTSDEASICI